MADQAKNEEAGAKAAKPVYYVENTVRRVGTRLHRAKSATRHRFKTFINGQRLLRGQKTPMTEEQFQANEAKIMEMVLAGQVALHRPDGMRITSTPDGRLIYRRADGAVKIAEEPTAVPKAPKPAPKKVEVEPEVMTSAEPTVETPAEPDDLTALPGIGAGRARKLEASGINSFRALIAAGPAKLAEVLGVAEEVAEEVVEAAQEKME